MIKLDTLLSSQETPAHHPLPLSNLPGLVLTLYTRQILANQGVPRARGGQQTLLTEALGAFVLSGVLLTTRKLRDGSGALRTGGVNAVDLPEAATNGVSGSWAGTRRYSGNDGSARRGVDANWCTPCRGAGPGSSP
jgi:hypothetical protein